MNTDKLKKAVIFGTIALIWSVPSLNLAGVIGSILSWIAYSRPRKGSSIGAMTAYIIAAVGSILLAAFLYLSSTFVEKDGQDPETAALAERILLMGSIGAAVGVVLYIIAAVYCYKSSVTPPQEDPYAQKNNSNGFFE